jgi:hypothetical protein
VVDVDTREVKPRPPRSASGAAVDRPAELDRLPFIDEHSIEIEASPEAAWDAVARMIEASFTGAGTSGFARIVGCADVEAKGPRPLAPGATFPGFHVVSADTPHELALAGSHHFSDYALILRVDDVRVGRVRVRAETRAVFPGLQGSLYRALVLGTGMHVLVTRRVLGAVKHSAELGTTTGAWTS